MKNSRLKTWKQNIIQLLRNVLSDSTSSVNQQGVVIRSNTSKNRIFFDIVSASKSEHFSVRQHLKIEFNIQLEIYAPDRESGDELFDLVLDALVFQELTNTEKIRFDGAAFRYNDSDLGIAFALNFSFIYEKVYPQVLTLCENSSCVENYVSDKSISPEESLVL